MRSPAPLSATQREVLRAIAEAVVPHAFADADRGRALVDAVLARIARLHPRKRRDLGLAISLLGARPAAVVAGLPPSRFERQSVQNRTRILEAWAQSRIPLMRTVLQSVRRLVLLVEYGTEDAQREVGYRGAYHTRGPAVPWEGALAGTPSDDEPVARAPIPEAAHRQPVSSTRLTPLTLDGSVLRCDAVVIGTGAGGATAAARLAESGLDVLVAEGGELVQPSEFDEREGPLFERLYADGGLRTTDDLGVAMVQGVTVGGSTTVNWMIMLRTPDWVLDGAAKLGWSAQHAVINARNCIRTGFCGYGCRSGAKQGTLETFLPRALAAGARLIVNAEAQRIEFVERGGPFPKKRIVLQQRLPDGRVRDVGVEAKVVVVAGGAVGTPVLLQRSGLGGGAVGKYLRLHPTTGLNGIYDREIYAAGGIPMTSVCDEFHRLDANGYGVWIETPPLHPALAATACPGIGEPHRAKMLQFRNTGSLVILTRDGADREQSNGDVRLRRDGSVSIRYAMGRTDRAHALTGLEAAAQLHFAMGAREVISGHARGLTMRHPDDIARLRERPMGPNDLPFFSAHVNGTCRFGTDPRSAGTDPHGERFGAPGVFVADGSLLPTAPGVNPQETIFALSTIVAERIASRVRGG
ncbi:GMC family oxidoreductase N-terminal domain-containing protein [Pseudogemmatithrix spongiicola]|uniref:GMC family oxidoreductase N-terminal domain-containing protein n=1 Tax=Pseudogemmatithrix spongiicola TaxID=3062599 RepID=A0AA49JX25_9BACT|nr:GMC family oxidoreductase N-terminal domain-containing protein [Gemmatimonadaceae bacterium 'strain 138']WKW16512.1 GMC family oxidoreductase N-terminal domain-containing protein [Gemmatimonadaceae bacterium 'strain 318']